MFLRYPNQLNTITFAVSFKFTCSCWLKRAKSIFTWQLRKKPALRVIVSSNAWKVFWVSHFDVQRWCKRNLLHFPLLFGHRKQLIAIRFVLSFLFPHKCWLKQKYFQTTIEEEATSHSQIYFKFFKRPSSCSLWRAKVKKTKPVTLSIVSRTSKTINCNKLCFEFFIHWKMLTETKAFSNDNWGRSYR